MTQQTGNAALYRARQRAGGGEGIMPITGPSLCASAVVDGVAYSIEAARWAVPVYGRRGRYLSDQIDTSVIVRDGDRPKAGVLQVQNRTQGRTIWIQLPMWPYVSDYSVKTPMTDGRGGDCIDTAVTFKRPGNWETGDSHVGDVLRFQLVAGATGYTDSGQMQSASRYVSVPYVNPKVLCALELYVRAEPPEDVIPAQQPAYFLWAKDELCKRA